MFVKNPNESGGIPLNQVPSTGQQHYHSHSLRGNGRNGDRGSGDLPGNGRHYPHTSDGGCGGPHDILAGDDGGPPDDLYEGGSDISSCSEFER